MPGNSTRVNSGSFTFFFFENQLWLFATDFDSDAFACGEAAQNLSARPSRKDCFCLIWRNDSDPADAHIESVETIF
jgi:hypothetical protein